MTESFKNIDELKDHISNLYTEMCFKISAGKITAKFFLGDREVSKENEAQVKITSTEKNKNLIVFYSKFLREDFIDNTFDNIKFFCDGEYLVSKEFSKSNVTENNEFEIIYNLELSV